MESNLIALDVGDRRVGIAIAGHTARIARPYGVIDRQVSDVWQVIEKLISEENVITIVVGLPRGMEGQETAQTAKIREFATELKQRLGVAPRLQDEAVTSQMAEDELKARGVSYNKGDIDALAATYILSDYLSVNAED